MMKSKSTMLVLCVHGGLTLEEIREVLRLVREIEQRDPSRQIFCSVSGPKGMSLDEATKILREIFPSKGVAA